MISSKTFIVFGLIFRSLINFEFIFLYGVREWSNFIFIHVVVQFSQQHLLKNCIRKWIESFPLSYSRTNILIKTIDIISFKSPYKKSKTCQCIMIGDLCFHYVLFYNIIPLFSSSICCCSVPKSYPTLCDLMDWNMSGSSVCPPLSPRVCSCWYPLSWWCYLTISPFTVLFSFCLPFSPASASTGSSHQVVKVLELQFQHLL